MPYLRPLDGQYKLHRMAGVSVLQCALSLDRPRSLAGRELCDSAGARTRASGGCIGRRVQRPLSRPFLRPFPIEKRRGSSLRLSFFVAVRSQALLPRGTITRVKQAPASVFLGGMLSRPLMDWDFCVGDAGPRKHCTRLSLFASETPLFL